MTSLTTKATAPGPAPIHPRRRSQAVFPAIIAADALVLIVYVWLISVGTWTHWTGRWHLYDDLATSFAHKQLAFAQLPDPALLALRDPYDPVARIGIPAPQDLSLFQGRFYAYFGPVPALLLIPAKALIPGTIGDQYLVFGFVAGILLVVSWLLAFVRGRFFPEVSAWILPPAIVTAGLTNPWPWMLSTPAVYGAAITAGVFLFLLGFAVLLHALQQWPRYSWRLALVGFLWGAAVGCRLTLLVPVAVISIIVGLSVLLAARRSGSIRRAFPALLCIGLPLLVVAAGLAWYNWARFGSVAETGFRYALAGISFREHGQEVFSPLFVLQNLYNYTLNPFSLKYAFPYINPARGLSRSVISLVPLPAIYGTQETSGLVYNAPFLALALVPLIGFLRKRGEWSPPADAQWSLGVSWITLALGGWLIGTLIVFAVYFWVAERFIAEFMPPLFLLSAIGYLQLSRATGKGSRAAAVLRVVIVVLALISILLSILVSISFNADGFRQLNPVLWRQLSNLFRP